MTKCSKCGVAVDEQKGQNWAGAMVCDPCFRALRMAKAREKKKFEQGKKPAGSVPHQGIGAVLAIVGGIIATVGWKMISPVAGLAGPNDATGVMLFRGGLVVCLIGCLWFALGRAISGKRA